MKRVISFLGLALLSRNPTKWWCVQALRDTETSSPAITVPEIESIAYQDLKDAFGKSQESATCDGSLTKQNLLKSISKAFGPDGLGFLEVSGIPDTVVSLRSNVLGMAQTLATLSAHELEEITLPSSMYSIGWSHGKEQFRGEYDTGKGSFYFDPFDDDATNRNVYPSSMQPHLEHSLLEISIRMTEIGTWVASLCDLYLQEELQQRKADLRNEDVSEGEAEPLSIRQSLTGGKYAKGRLLYYFPSEARSSNRDILAQTEDDSSLDSWCGWHKDHSSLTILIPGKLILDNDVDTSCCKQVNDNKAGLYIRSRGQAVHVQLPPTSIGVQLGETLEIMSRGLFRATPHAVRGSNNPKAGRSSLALFLQPSLGTNLPKLYPESTDDSLRQRWRPNYGAFQDATLKAFL